MELNKTETDDIFQALLLVFVVFDSGEAGGKH